jgi:hypothetical protein
MDRRVFLGTLTGGRSSHRAARRRGSRTPCEERFVTV